MFVDLGVFIELLNKSAISFFLQKKRFFSKKNKKFNTKKKITSFLKKS